MKFSPSWCVPKKRCVSDYARRDKRSQSLHGSIILQAYLTFSTKSKMMMFLACSIIARKLPYTWNCRIYPPSKASSSWNWRLTSSGGCKILYTLIGVFLLQLNTFISPSQGCKNSTLELWPSDNVAIIDVLFISKINIFPSYIPSMA